MMSINLINIDITMDTNMDILDIMYMNFMVIYTISHLCNH